VRCNERRASQRDPPDRPEEISMPTKKTGSDQERAKAPPAPAPQQEQRSGERGAAGRSGRGADSVLAQLIEQEKTRTTRIGRN
jgi:hypothetical protein